MAKKSRKRKPPGPKTLARYEDAVRYLREQKVPITRKALAGQRGITEPAVGAFLRKHPQYVKKWHIASAMEPSVQKKLHVRLRRLAHLLSRIKQRPTMTRVARILDIDRGYLYWHFRKDPSLHTIIVPFIAPHHRMLPPR